MCVSSTMAVCTAVATVAILHCPKTGDGLTHEWSSRSAAFRTNSSVNSVGNWKEYKEGPDKSGVDEDRLIRYLGAGHGQSLFRRISVYERI
jgi:hypothetical protein